MLFLAYVAVWLVQGAEMVGFCSIGKVAVVGLVFALPDVEFFTQDDVTRRRPVP
jgi:hypothetical protein